MLRDRAALAALDNGIKALGATPRKSVRRNEGRTQVDVLIADVAFSPGDILFADEDGVLILTAAQVARLYQPTA